jgi:hypothetical protein
MGDETRKGGKRGIKGKEREGNVKWKNETRKVGRKIL